MGVRLMPIISGTFGPYTSASIRPALYPNEASPTARLTDTVVFPTPPFPEPTAIRFLTPGIGSFGCSACAVVGPINSILEHSPIPSRRVREVWARPDREESPHLQVSERRR